MTHIGHICVTRLDTCPTHVSTRATYKKLDTLTFEPLELQTCQRCQNRGFWGCWVDLNRSQWSYMCLYTCHYTYNSTVHCLFGLSKWPLTQIGGSQNYLGSWYWSEGKEPSTIYIDRNCNHIGGHKKSITKAQKLILLGGGIQCLPPTEKGLTEQGK